MSVWDELENTWRRKQKPETDNGTYVLQSIRAQLVLCTAQKQ